MVWYPSILSFIAATLAYTINPDLAASPMFILSVIIPLFWLVTALNLFGLHTSVKVNDFCGLIGTIFPMILLIIFGAIWVVQGQPIHIRFDNLLPSWNHITTWISLVSIMAGFLGMELSGTHINEIHNPQKNFPRAILVASLFILFSLLLGSLTIAIVIPQHEISLVAGVIEVFDRFFSLFHLRALLPIMTLIIVIGNFATLINWILAPAKGFLHAAELGFLPPLLAQKNRFGAPYLILIIQAILVTVFSCIFFLIPSVSGFYWFLLALSTSPLRFVHL